jgi:predicted O-linked N-acetylglucosamine transferase (SPINDLY family)
MDYRVTDAYLDPMGTEMGWTERALPVPRSYFCYEPPANAPPVGELPAKRNGYLTFGSFNSLAKISGGTVRLWAEVLSRVPGAKLRLQASGLGSAVAGGMLRERFEKERISSDRVVLTPPSKLNRYFAQLSEIDVALDTLPFNAGTTTCHGLWMGVPCVTLAGDTPVSRMGRSILNNAGMQEWVARDESDFVAMASRLAGDVEGLENFRKDARERVKSSPLCDAVERTHDLELTLRGAWQRWCET